MIESDELSSQVFKEDSEGEEKIELESAKKDLEEKVAFLTKENNVLKAQFSSAVKITDQLKEAKMRSEKLASELRKSNAENEDLKRRIEIANKSYEELNTKYTHEKETSMAQHQNEEQSQKAEIARIKSQFQAQIDEIESDLDNTKEANNALEIQQKSFAAKADRLLDSLSYFFQTEFESIDDLCEYVEQQQTANQQTQVLEPTRTVQSKSLMQNNQETSELKQKIKSLQKQLKQALLKVESVDSEKQLLQKQTRELESKLATQEKENEIKIKRMKEEYELKNDDQQHQITILSNKVTNLKSDIQRKSMRETTVIAPPSPMKQQAQEQTQVSQKSQTSQIKVEKSIKKEPETNAGFEQLLNKNNELAKQISTIKEQKEKTEKLLIEAQSKLNASASEIQQLQTDAVAFNHIKEELNAEIETLRTALRSQPKEENVDDKKKYRKQYTAAKSKIAKLEATIESQKKILLETQMDVEKSHADVKEMQAKLTSAQSELEATNLHLKKVNSEAADLQRKLDDVKPPEEVPSYAFHVADFDKELTVAIEKIGSNKSLQIASRIQSALKQTASFYNTKVDEAVKEADKALSVIQSLRTGFGKFVVDLSIAAVGKAYTFDDFVSNNAGSILVNSVAQLHTERDELFRQNETAQNCLEQVAEILGIEGDVIQGVTEYREEHEKTNENLQRKTKKAKEFKTCFESLQKKHGSESKDMNQQIQDAQNTIQKLSNELTEAHNEASALRKNVQALTLQLREAAENHEAMETQLQEEHEEAEQAAATDFAQREQNLQAEIDELSQHLENVQGQLDEQIEENSQLKQIIASQSSQIEEGNQINVQLKKESESRMKQQEQKSSMEKEQISSSYENAMTELKGQCERLRADIEKLSGDLGTANKKIKETKESLFNTKRDKYRLESELKARNEELEREKALSKSNREVDQIEAEAKLAQKVDQTIQESEKEKRELIAFAANEFSEYSFANGPIDEKFFKTIVSRAHSKLSKLTSSDAAIRRMVNAGSKQTTEDAVAQLLLDQ